MRKLVFSAFFFFPLASAFAQSPAPDSLHLWVEAAFNDSAGQVTLRPRLANLSSLPGYFHYQLRLAEAKFLPDSLAQNQLGLVFAAPGDTSNLPERTLPLIPGKDFDAYVYLSEEEFVVAEAYWNFETEYAAHLNRPAQQKAKPPLLAKDDFDIDGLVFNETRTPFGREFYRKFMEFWQPPEKANGYFIALRENLTIGRYTKISVHLNNRELFQRYLVPRGNAIAELAEQAAQYVAGLLQNGQYDGSLTHEDLFGKL